jgi:hypothetical protein
MTATVSGTSLTRPRIAYFWWLREARRSTTATTDAVDTYVCSDRDYIPASTADMWGRGAPQRLR